MQPFRNLIIRLLLASLFTLLIISTSHAHGVTVFAWVEDDTVHTESRSSDGRGIADGIIHVFDDRTDQKLLVGRTDNQGRFKFKTPLKGRLRIELKTKTGHNGRWIVPDADFKPISDADATTDDVNPVKKTPSEPTHTSLPVSTRQLEASLARVLDQKLNPVLKMLSRLQRDDPTIPDILGGLGYILGLVGIGTYVGGRCRSKGSNTDHGS